MKATFATEFGNVECVRHDDGLGLAYFVKDDIETGITVDGNIFHPNGGTFRILWPIRGMNSPDAILQVLDYRTIGNVLPE